MDSWAIWIGFNILVLVMLALDLGVLHRDAKPIYLREATIWSILWVLIALAFNGGMLYWYGPPDQRHTLALQFFTGYLIERALSIDNIFVFLVLFNYFAVEPRFQYRVLFWGILGALMMRGAMIAMGVALISRFSWVLYVFGAFLVWTGFKLLFHKTEDMHPEQNPVLRYLLPSITTPTQIVAGRDDDLVPWSNNQYLDDLLPNSQIHSLDAGHFAWEQAAEEYGRLVVDWISGGYGAHQRELSARSLAR